MKRRIVMSHPTMFFVVVLATIGVLTLVAAGCGGPEVPVTPDGGSEGASTSTSAPSPIGTSVAEAPTSLAPTSLGPAISTSTTTTVPPTTAPGPAETILQGMTLREKAAQALLLAFDGATLLPATEALLTETPPGGLLLLSRNVTSPEQLTALTAALQQAAAAGGSRTGLLIAVDQEGGPVQRIRTGVPNVPAARVLGEEVSLAETMRLAEETAASLLRLGVNMNLAPVADVVSDPGSFLYRRTYGGDPTRVADYVEAVTMAYMRTGLIPVVKHFPGHGSASGNTHGEIVFSKATQTEFATTHLLPFKAAVAGGVECVMVAHIVANAYDPDRPASLSGAVVQGLLRDGLGFSGVVITDDLEMIAAPGMLTEDGTVAAGEPGNGAGDIGDIAVCALAAGCDLLISTGSLERQLQMRDAVVEAVEQGRLSRERLNEAVLRVLELKARHGLLAS